MSWDKNTINNSTIDSRIEYLKKNKKPYNLKVLGKVAARGINDEISGVDFYEIRALKYDDKLVIERMFRHPDCDADDYIQSIVFHSEEGIFPN